ncbi:MAG: hypothetical protein RJQ09_10835 [Cyclobacteriaceae bacterium]
MRYFPQYSQIIKIVLTQLKKTGIIPVLNAEKLNCGLFGSGPCPEAYGIAQFIDANLPECRAVQSISFDINASSWEYSRNITHHSLIPAIFGHRAFGIKAVDFDLTIPISIESFNDRMSKMNLIVFQNCLNETNPNQHMQVLQNLKTIYDNLSSGTLLIFIDLSGFSNVKRLLSTFQSQVKPDNIVEPLNDASKRYFAADLVNTMPQILRTNLLNGNRDNQNGLIPRVNIDYHTLIIKK